MDYNILEIILIELILIKFFEKPLIIFTIHCQYLSLINLNTITKD